MTMIDGLVTGASANPNAGKPEPKQGPMMGPMPGGPMSGGPVSGDPMPGGPMPGGPGDVPDPCADVEPGDPFCSGFDLDTMYMNYTDPTGMD